MGVRTMPCQFSHKAWESCSRSLIVKSGAVSSCDWDRKKSARSLTSNEWPRCPQAPHSLHHITQLSTKIRAQFNTMINQDIWDLRIVIPGKWRERSLSSWGMHGAELLRNAGRWKRGAQVLTASSTKHCLCLVDECRPQVRRLLWGHRMCTWRWIRRGITITTFNLCNLPQMSVWHHMNLQKGRQWVMSSSCKYQCGRNFCFSGHLFVRAEFALQLQMTLKVQCLACLVSQASRNKSSWYAVTEEWIFLGPFVDASWFYRAGHLVSELNDFRVTFAASPVLKLSLQMSHLLLHMLMLAQFPKFRTWTLCFETSLLASLTRDIVQQLKVDTSEVWNHKPGVVKVKSPFTQALVGTHAVCVWMFDWKDSLESVQDL